MGVLKNSNLKGRNDLIVSAFWSSDFNCLKVHSDKIFSIENVSDSFIENATRKNPVRIFHLVSLRFNASADSRKNFLC